jgi:hypothetical protein
MQPQMTGAEDLLGGCLWLHQNDRICWGGLWFLVVFMFYILFCVATHTATYIPYLHTQAAGGYFAGDAGGGR